MPSSLKLSNNGTGRLTANLAAGAAAVSLTPGDGAKFPALAEGQWFPATLVRSDGVIEIIKVTARAGDVLTAERGQEGTAAVAFTAGDRVEHRLTSGALQGEFGRVEGLANAAQAAADTAQGAANAAQATASAALPKAGGELSGALNEAKAANVASAASPNIWGGNGNVLHITGTTAITGFTAAPQAGARRKLIFDGAVVLTHGANLIIPGAANYTTAVGDIVEVIADTTTVFRLEITRANGTPVKMAQATETVAGAAEVATQAETDAGTDDARIVTPKKQRNGFAISLGANGYMFLPTWLSGWGMQWGSVSAPTNGGAGQTVNFPITFPNACRVVVAIPHGIAGPFNGEYLTVSGWDTIKFVATYTCGRHYIAIGN